MSCHEARGTGNPASSEAGIAGDPPPRGRKLRRLPSQAAELSPVLASFAHQQMLTHLDAAPKADDISFFQAEQSQASAAIADDAGSS